MGLRHNLDTIRVLDDNGKVNANGGKYEGMDRYEARKAVVADLEALGLMEKIEDYSPQRGGPATAATTMWSLSSLPSGL